MSSGALERDNIQNNRFSCTRSYHPDYYLLMQLHEYLHLNHAGDLQTVCFNMLRYWLMSWLYCKDSDDGRSPCFSLSKYLGLKVNLNQWFAKPKALYIYLISTILASHILGLNNIAIQFQTFKCHLFCEIVTMQYKINLFYFTWILVLILILYLEAMASHILSFNVLPVFNFISIYLFDLLIFGWADILVNHFTTFP